MIDLQRVAILGGLPGRNIPEMARDCLHFQQGQVGRSIPPRITDLVVLRSFVGHVQTVSAIRQMKSRGGRIHFVWGSRSALERALREQVLPAMCGQSS